MNYKLIKNDVWNTLNGLYNYSTYHLDIGENKKVIFVFYINATESFGTQYIDLATKQVAKIKEYEKNGLLEVTDEHSFIFRTSDYFEVDPMTL